MYFARGIGGTVSFVVLMAVSCSNAEVDQKTAAQELQCRSPDFLPPPNWNAHKDEALDPLNLIVSGNSDITIGEITEMLTQGNPSWAQVLPGIDPNHGKCINSVQASVNAGSTAVDEQFAMRPKGCDVPLLVSMKEGNPLQNHFRAWPQHATGAWFLAVSEEHFCPFTFPPRLAHCIDSNGFNKGRFDLVDQVVDIAAQRGMAIALSTECQDPIPVAGCLAVGTAPRPSGTNQDGVFFDGFATVLIFKKPAAPPHLPAGSYRASCRACSVNPDGFLSCICDDIEGSPISSILNSCDCDSPLDIANCNGELTCGGCQVPPGSYQQSCSNCFARSDRLTCGTCKRGDGTDSNLPTLALPCSGDIINCDGVLRCGSC